jgi:hypothetical protein
MPDQNLPATRPAERLARFIEEAALNESFDADKFIALVRVQLEIQDRQDKGDFNEAVAAVQGDLVPIVRQAENRHLGNKYAGLDAVVAVLNPLCRKHGLSTRFGSMEGAQEGWTRKSLTVALARYSETTWMDFPTKVAGSRGGATQMNEQQQVGAVSTYARRYLLNEFFNLETIANQTDDTDGHTGGSDKLDDKPKPDPKTTPDPAALFPSVAKNLLRATTAAHVDSLAANPQVVAFRNLQTPANQALIDKMIADRRAALAAAAAPTDLPDIAWDVSQSVISDPETLPPSELLTRVLRRIASCEATAALDSCAIAPEFTTDLAKLQGGEAQIADEAIKARYRALEGAKP